MLPASAELSLYGDSISDFIGFDTFNQALQRTLAGRIRLAENAGLLATGDITNGRPGWDLAIAGTTVSAITRRFTQLIGRDEAGIVTVLMGANNYGADGPGTGTVQDWIARADEIVAAARAAGKILVLIPPVSHHNDPVPGRDALKAYLPTLASDRVIVPDSSGFDWRIHTDDGVHPNAAGAAYLAQQVTLALAPLLAPAYDFSAIGHPGIDLVRNGDLDGVGGVLVNAALGQTGGQVATGWTLRRIAASGQVVAAKGVDRATGDATQILSLAGGKGEARLSQQIEIFGHAGEQYEIAVSVKVTDPAKRFLGFRAWDSDSGDGVLFGKTVNPVLASGGTGSYQTVLRSARVTLAADQFTATVNLSAYFGLDSGASVEIGDVMVRRVEGTANLAGRVTTGTEGFDRLAANDGGQVLAGLGGHDVLVGGSGNDRLIGGAGADTMMGGAGDDTYVVDSAADKVFETPSRMRGDPFDMGGWDLVETSVNWSIASNIPGRQFIEAVTLVGNATAATGNDLANVLTGNALANVLNGEAGNDTLIGGAGNDRLVGGSGADVLIGGAGRDTLTGGAGDDLFRIEMPLPGQADTIVDFASGQDHLVLAGDAFPGLGRAVATTGKMPLFAAGDGLPAGASLIYSQATGILSWDPDGSGALGATALVRLGNHASLLAGDILLL